MLNLYNAEAAPDLENTFFDTLVGNRSFPGARNWYILERRRISDAYGGRRLRANGAVDAYQGALDAGLGGTDTLTSSD